VSMSNLSQFQPFVSRESLPSDSAQSLWTPSTYQPKWYAVFTLPRHEKHVFAQCLDRQIESFLPLYKVKHRWKNRCTVDLEMPLFPCYSFIRIEPQVRIHVLQLRGVVSIISSGREPLPVPDEDINSLREGLLVHKIEPHPEVAVGDWVRIKTGPMAGAEGVLDRRKNGLRVIVKLEMLARSISVEVGSDEIDWRNTRTSPARDNQ
jgi:transcription antitermination factor NusG